MIAEMRAPAPNIRDYTDYVPGAKSCVLPSLGRVLYVAGRPAQAIRPRRVCLLDTGVLRRCPQAHHRIPYGRTTPSSYRFTYSVSRGTIVLFGGF